MSKRECVFFDTEDELRWATLNDIFGQSDEFELIPELTDDQSPSAILIDAAVSTSHLKLLALQERQRSYAFTSLIVIANGSMNGQDFEAFESSADGIIREPFWMTELLSLMRLQIRNHLSLTSEPARFSHLIFTPVERVVRNKEGKEVVLSTLEARLLHHLFRASGKLVRRDLLLREVWGYVSSVDTTTVQTHVHRIRQKLRLLIDRENIIFTEGDSYGLLIDIRDAD